VSESVLNRSKGALLRGAETAAALRRDGELRRLKRLARREPRFQPGETTVGGFRVRYPDALSLYMEYKDIFRAGIYDFTTDAPAPRVIDGGSYIGMSALRTKLQHPDARVTCFEPDPQIRATLEHNIEANGLTDVDVVPKALGPDDGTAGFVAEGADGGHIADGAGDLEIETTRLSPFLDEPVHFLKLNIEGFELPVLREAAGRLHNVEQTVIEYHGWPHAPQRLGELLTLLDDAGFRYLVNHFDYETNPAVRPPFTVDASTQWFALVHASRA
jgi:FkbM family methyltransferase